MKQLHLITFLLLAVGGLNWLLVGLLDFNLVMKMGSLLGEMGSLFERLVYILVGVSAAYQIFTHKQYCSYCKSGMGGQVM